jgi:tubulin epsilon
MNSQTCTVSPPRSFLPAMTTLSPHRTTGSHRHTFDFRLTYHPSLLALNELIEHADCVLPIENEALFQMSARTSEASSSAASNPFDAMNNIVGELLCNLTASIRFEGEMNVDLNEICSTLVPFPSLHFLVASMCPLGSTGNSPSKRHVLGHFAPRSAGHTKELDQMFVNCFERYSVYALIAFGAAS